MRDSGINRCIVTSVRCPAAFLLLLLLAPRIAGAVSSPPNVVVILADDQGWGDLSASGNRNLATPHVDSLARDGALFERFCVQPVCSPTRAEFLTGRHHPRGGVWDVSTGGERLDLAMVDPKLYPSFQPPERLTLLLQAMTRGDDAEVDRLTAS